MMPPAVMLIAHSPSPMHGDWLIFTIRCSPLPLRIWMMWSQAWDMMLPPTALAGSDITWFVMTTAIWCSSAVCFRSLRSTLIRCCLSASSPRPLYSTRKGAISESITSTRNGCSTSISAAPLSASSTLSGLYARQHSTFSMMNFGSNPNRVAMGSILSGRKLPSVSMKSALPSAPPICSGWKQAMHSVTAIWLLPDVRFSPYRRRSS
mmetsp:Transcript_8083/g.18083  ORF Transcript_8083/g.18083 Transcript_8083/m.18083 type:complete len:207 (+) Transcript_8083:451-1071(+)